MRSLQRLLYVTAGLLILAACGRPEKSGVSSAVSSDLGRLPKDLQTLGYADLQSLRGSELGQQFRAAIDSQMIKEHHGEDYQAFVEATGFDVRKDVHAVLVGAQAHFADSTRHVEGAGFAVVRGAFDEGRIVAYLQSKEHGEHKLTTTTYNGKTIYTGPRGKQAAYFADAGTLIVGTEEWLKLVIDNQLSGKTALENQELMGMIGELRHKDQLWAVGTTGNLMDRLAAELGKEEHFKATKSLRSLRSGLFSAQVGATAELWGTMTCGTEEDGRLMADALKGALAMAKLAVSDDRDMVDMLNRFEVEAKGARVQLSGKIDKPFLDKLKEKHTLKKMALL